MNTLRTLSSTDIAAMRELCIASWAQYESLLDVEGAKALRENIHRLKTYEELVSTSRGFGMYGDDDSLQAISFVTPSGEADEVYQSNWSRLRFVTVHPDARGKGVGRQLVQHCIEDARAHGEEWMALHTSEHMKAARSIYESLGFVLQREIPSRYGMRYWLYTMQL